MNTEPNQENTNKEQNPTNPPNGGKTIPPLSQIDEPNIERSNSKEQQCATSDFKEPYTPPKRVGLLQFFRKANPVEWGLLGMTIVLTVANILIIIYAADQVKITKYAVELSSQQTNKSIAAAESANVFTKRSINLAEKNARAELRPYITLDSIWNIKIKANHRIEATVNLRNFGRTYARRFYSWGIFFISPDSAIYWVYFAKGRMKGYSERPDLIGALVSQGAHSEIPITSQYLMSKNDITKIHKDGMYFVAAVFYRDIFGDEHTMTFCFKYVHTVGFTLFGHFDDAD